MSGPWRHVDTDPLSGIECYFQYDHAEQKFHVRHVQKDVAPLLDRNKALYNHDDRGYSADPDRWLRRVASIPAIIQLKWLDEEGLDIMKNDPETVQRLRRKLNDPDWRFLRTAPGQL